MRWLPASGYRLRQLLQLLKGVAKLAMDIGVVSAKPDSMTKGGNGFFIAALRGQSG